MTKKPKEQEQVEKIKVISPEMIVTMMGARPYYEIKYFDISDCKWHIGYSSYDLKNVIEWKNKCFEVIDTNDGWIPCNVKLPKRQDSEGSFLTMYLVQMSFGRIRIGFVNEKGAWMNEHGNRLRVIAWQPLPEPYKGE